MTLAVNRTEVVPTPAPTQVPEVTEVLDTTPPTSVGVQPGAEVEEDQGFTEWNDAAAAQVARGIILATASERRGRARQRPRISITALTAARANHELRDIEWDEKDRGQNPS